MYVKEYIQIHKNTTEMPVEEGYEQIVNTRGNANGKHMGSVQSHEQPEQWN